MSSFTRANRFSRKLTLLTVVLQVPFYATTFVFPHHPHAATMIVSSSLHASLVSEEDSAVSSSDNGPLPGTPLKMIVDERKQFELGLGKAVDTLRKNYPRLLTEAPDFSIYHDDLEVVDPSGVTLRGIPNYEMSFRVVHSVVGFFYCPESSGLTFKLVYDWARNNIRVSWNAELIPRNLYGGAKNTLYVDGISVYDMDRSSGLITHHHIEYLLVNGTPVNAPGGLVNAMQDEMSGVVSVPGGFGMSSPSPNDGGLEFATVDPHRPGQALGLSNVLFHRPSSSSPPSGSTSSTSLSATSNPTSDSEGFKRKNEVRARFGLKPLTHEEYERVETETNNLVAQQQMKKDAHATLTLDESPKQKKANNFFSRLMDNALSDFACEDNWDCERPMVCCDFKVKKICCASGQRIASLERAVVLVPETINQGIPDVGKSLPRGGPHGNMS